MTYQVVLVDSLYNYQSIMQNDDGQVVLEYYQEQLDNNFSGTYSLVPDTYSLNAMQYQTDVAYMTDPQNIGIQTLLPGCLFYCLVFSF